MSATSTLETVTRKVAFFKCQHEDCGHEWKPRRRRDRHGNLELEVKPPKMCPRCKRGRTDR